MKTNILKWHIYCNGKIRSVQHFAIIKNTKMVLVTILNLPCGTGSMSMKYPVLEAKLKFL